jgi:DNA modification methylase
MATPQKPTRHRRAMSAKGGPVTALGNPRDTRVLADALAIPEEESPRILTHAFHSYPARFHPLLVRRLITDALPPGGTLLDPFVGSGTTLVEGALLGARTLGVDVNPLAVELARLKATVFSAERRVQIGGRAHAAAERSLDRVKRRARTKDSGEKYDDPKRYAPHVFRELVGLREELAAEPDEEIRRVLLLVLSAIVVKVSRQPSDTAAGTVERSLGKGMATRIFHRKADELVRLLAELAAKVPPRTPPPDVRLGDARHVSHVRPGSVDVIVTSPPYLGTYDYAEQHARRFGWLGLDPRSFEALEIGARRRAKTPDAALMAWQTDVDAFVAEFARVLKPEGRAFVVIGDSAIGSRVIPGDQAIRTAAARAKLTLLASAAQARPNFYEPAARITRSEHLLLLTRR